MGIYKSFNTFKGKWQWEGCNFVKYYDTEEECDADRENVWKRHMKNLKSWNFVCNWLASYRYR